MPSIRAYLTSWAIWAVFFFGKRATLPQLLAYIRDHWREEIEKEVAPAAVLAATRVTEEIFEGTGAGAQRWKVFHLSRKGEEGVDTNKVVIYWHGGAFIRAAAGRHWGVVQRLVDEHNIPVVFPQYTLAPLGTADAWCLNALQFTLNVASDPRYKGKMIVHMGDSAGGWMALRIRQLMFGTVLGEEAGFDGMKDRVQELTSCTGASILISPVVNFEITDRLLKKDLDDPWLSINIVKMMRSLWVRGPSSAPEIAFGLPSNHTPVVPQATDDTDALYADPRYSLNNGLDIFTRYHTKHPDAPPVRLLTMIGTYDICHVGTEEMQERLEKLGPKVVRADYIEEAGLNHVYPIFPHLPEARRAWEKIGEVLRE